MVTVSNVSACHISSWLMAVLGMKSLPRSQPQAVYHSFAFSFVHTSRVAFTVSCADRLVSCFSFVVHEMRVRNIKRVMKGEECLMESLQCIWWGLVNTI